MAPEARLASGAMELTHRPFLRSRGADRSLTVLVVVMLADIAVFSPLVGMGLLNRHAHDIAVVLVVGLGAFAIWTHLMAARVLGMVVAALALVRLANFWVPDASVRALDASLMLAACGLLAGLVLRQTLAGRGRMNWHRVQGAVAAYVLVGAAFAQAYRLVAMHAPGTFFRFGALVDYDRIVPELGYFSFITLTTLGFGDITPAHPIARSLAMLEALFGVLYPVIMISWLVTLEVEAERAGHREGGTP